MPAACLRRLTIRPAFVFMRSFLVRPPGVRLAVPWKTCAFVPRAESLRVVELAILYLDLRFFPQTQLEDVGLPIYDARTGPLAARRHFHVQSKDVGRRWHGAAGAYDTPTGTYAGAGRAFAS
jgi:hypothetical protein